MDQTKTSSDFAPSGDVRKAKSFPHEFSRITSAGGSVP
jgi:hypothetical protein